MTEKDRLDWAESVERGQYLARVGSQNKWAIADLALETFPWTGMRASSFANRWTPKEDLPRTIMERWLEETGLELSLASLKEFRTTAFGWPPEKRVEGVSFSCHRMVRGKANRFQLLQPGMTLADLNIVVQKAQSGKSMPNAARSIDASASFINTALKALGNRRLSAAQIEFLGEHVAKLEANLEALLERLEMTEPELRSVA